MGFHEIIAKHADPTISPDLHYTLIKSGFGVGTGRNASMTKRNWPPIAESWREFVDLCTKADLDPGAFLA
jgi:hypothetical protein